MPPLVPLFPPSELTERVQVVQSGFIKEKRRKGPPVELEKCVLLEMVQYSCNPPSEGIQPPGVVKCKPLVRLFRRCADSLTVETTVWEKTGTQNNSCATEAIGNQASQPQK
ncbi:hypothetical protein V8E54_010351 [Elaphomyces granulatus]